MKILEYVPGRTLFERKRNHEDLESLIYPVDSNDSNSDFESDHDNNQLNLDQVGVPENAQEQVGQTDHNSDSFIEDN